jgi:hypothetical protein
VSCPDVRIHRGRSSSQRSFPEVLSTQVSRLIGQMKEESTRGTEGDTRRQLREKIATLPHSQLACAADALSMIWAGLIDPLATPPLRPRPGSSARFNRSPAWDRVELALLKSMTTGAFIDVQFYAYNSIRDNSPLDPKPLFISSIVIEEFSPAIMARKLKGALDFTDF